MQPYYEDDNITIYNDDFRNIAVAADLLIADPPFNLWSDLAEDVYNTDYQSAALFTNWQNRDALSIFGKPRAELVWTFGDGRWVAHHLPRITHETILIYGKTYDAYVGRSMENIFPQNKGRGSVGKDKMPERTWVPRERAMLDSYFHYPRNVSTGVWSKPLPIMKSLTEWLCPKDGLIFDPFMGRGSALIASKQLGRRYVGCDISKEMCEASLATYLAA